MSREQRVFDMFDSDLELRAAGAAAITGTGADVTSPDFSSSIIDMNETGSAGVMQGRVIIRNFVGTYQAGVGHAIISVVGFDVAETTSISLASLFVGENEVIPGSSDILTVDEMSIYFSNLHNDILFPRVRLDVSNFGTSPSTDFLAFISSLRSP